MFRKTENGLDAFICRCDEEGSAEADILLREVRDRLSREGYAVTPGDFLTAVVVSLKWDYHAHIDRIYWDQWGMISAVRDEDKFSVLVQCDEAEDGIAAVWKAFADHASPVEDHGGVVEAAPTHPS